MWRAVVPVLALAMPTAGCVDDLFGCTLIYAPSGLVLDVEVSGGTLDDAVWQVAVRADGAELIFQYDATGVNGVCSPVFQGVCAVEEDVGDRRLRATMWLGSSGGMVNVHYVGDDGGPAIVTVELQRAGGEVVGGETFEPAYRTVAPNGRGCGEVEQSTATMTIDLGGA